MERSSPLVQFCRYMNVPITSAQNHRESLELCDITQVLLVVTLFNEGEYSTNKMIQMPCLSQSSFICPATSSFTLLNITVLMFLLVLFSIRLAHFPNLIGAFDFTPLPCLHHTSEGMYVFYIQIYPVDKLIWSVHHHWGAILHIHECPHCLCPESQRES